MQEKKQYEVVFILDSVLTKEIAISTVDDYQKYLNSQGAKIINREEWGVKKLAYPINHKKNGFYCIFEFKIYPNKISDFELKMKRDENIIRFLTVKMDKNAIEYSKKRLANIKKANENNEQVEKEDKK